jgi:hypothetical protein|tara:strand:+ start:553 stop:2250 length:1698 start_codon:yes stop_codon:yes gene_type:complete
LAYRSQKSKKRHVAIRNNPGVQAMVIALPNPGGKGESKMARRRKSKMTMASRYKRRAYGAKRRARANPISRKMAGGLEEYRLTTRKLKAKGLSTKGKLPTLKARLKAASGSDKAMKKASGGSPSSPKKRRVSAISRVSTARRSLAGGKGKRSVSAQMGTLKARVARAEKALRLAKGRVAVKPAKRRKKVARKNPGAESAVYLVGFGLGGFAIEQLLAGGLRKAWDKTIQAQADTSKRDMYINAVELGVPTVGSIATYMLHKKGIAILKDQSRMVATIAGMWGGYVARNVDAVTKMLVKVPGVGHLAVLGQENQLQGEVLAEYLKGVGKGKQGALESYYAGAAGLGRYVTSGALGAMPSDDDLYAGAAGVGRYMLDDTAFPMADDGSLERTGSAGMGEYIKTPATMDGLSGMHNDDVGYEDLMDELSGVPALTPDEEQAENILIPQLAYEAMRGGMGQVGPAATIKARQPNASIIRTTPGMAAKVEAYNIGEVIGPSQQVPGTVLVASSVAGRDIYGGAGPFIPTQSTAFKNPAIKEAQNVEVSPYGVFSRGVFSSTLPATGSISR